MAIFLDENLQLNIHNKVSFAAVMFTRLIAVSNAHYDNTHTATGSVSSEVKLGTSAFFAER